MLENCNRRICPAHKAGRSARFAVFAKEAELIYAEKENTRMTNKVYDLKVMACLETDAYDSMVYRTEKSEAETEEFLSYIKEHAMYWHDRKHEKIIALSTCDNATTSGRTVLVCAMTTRKHPLPDREYGKPIPHREAIGHPMAGAYWGLLNFTALLAVLYSLIKSVWARRRGIKQEYRVLALEAAVAACAVIIFILTEDMHKPMQMVDKWSFLMLLPIAAMWLIEKTAQSTRDIPLFRKIGIPRRRKEE